MRDNYCVTCGKTVCKGCLFGSAQVHKRDGTDRETAIEKIMACSFCRSSLQPPVKAMLEKTMRLANAGQHEGMYRLATYYCKGQMGLQQDIAEGVKWYHRAIEAGSGKAACSLGMCYLQGDGVDLDVEKALEYCQRAVELGFEPAYSSVGYILMERGEIEEGMLNFRKAAMCGTDDKNIFDELRRGFNDGFITKDEYAFTLRKSQAAVNERKSEERELYKEYLNYQDSPEGRKMLMKISGQSKSY